MEERKREKVGRVWIKNRMWTWSTTEHRDREREFCWPIAIGITNRDEFGSNWRQCTRERERMKMKKKKKKENPMEVQAANHDNY